MTHAHRIKGVLLGVPIMGSAALCYPFYHPFEPLVHNLWIVGAVVCAWLAMGLGLFLADRLNMRQGVAAGLLSVLWLYLVVPVLTDALVPLAGACCGFVAAVLVAGLAVWGEQWAGQ